MDLKLCLLLPQAGISLPFSLAQLRRIIIETVAHSQKMNGEGNPEDTLFCDDISS